MIKTYAAAVFMIFSILKVSAQNHFVNLSGVCGGSPCYTTIQAAVDAASAGESILVEAGTYNENVTINKSVILLSESGRNTTSIIGSDVSLGTILVSQGINDVQIGAAGQGFKIIGFDHPNPGVERAAIYLQGANENIRVIDNDVVAKGEGGLLTEYNDFYNNIIIDGNTFSGVTFDPAQPAACGGDQFSVSNYPRQLVAINPGSNVPPSYQDGFQFVNNQITGTSGTVGPVYLPGGGACPFGAGNSLVTIDALNAVVDANAFSGVTARFGSSLRVRGTGSSITNNCFIADGLLSPINSFLFYEDRSNNDALATAGNQETDELAFQNAYFGPDGDSYYDADANQENQYYITPVSVNSFVDQANNDCTLISSVACQTALICTPQQTPIPTLGQWALIILSLIIVTLGVVMIYGYEQISAAHQRATRL